MSWPDTLKLVLLPGLDGTSTFSGVFQSRFPSTTNLIAIDYPSDQLLDYDELTELVVDRLPKAGQFVLLTQSFSGPVAKRLVDHSGLAGVIFCASFVSSPRPFLLPLLSRSPLDTLFKINPPRFLLVQMCFGDDPDPEQVDLFYRVLRSSHSSVLAHRLRLIAAESERVKRLMTEVPVLYLRPSTDKLIPQGAVDELCSLVPTTKVKKISGAHFLLQTSPDAVVEEVCKFGNFIEGEA